ncbi:coiled-coil domain-containing protein 137 [Lutzomyia longipalpis]|uniref:coiled-coil domain-containing protein 137 n=1 Tax=Lutzomyia longipalpis TaxID=7200 RepID=UPI002483DFC0|nr:coiled-coil domain-containing protein 137 [Lutzomyia longipalpis]
MGRKIPAKHHHGVRDPIKQNHQRFLKIRDKIDNPPKNIKDQPISRATAEFIRLKEEAKAGTYRPMFGREDVPRPIRKKNKTELPRPYKEVQNHKPLKGEGARDFLQRVNRATQNSLKEAHYEAKYNVDIVRKESGEVEIQKRQVGSKGVPTQSRIVKFNAKKKLKKEKKKTRKEEDESDKMIFKKDVVKFGEVCHRPPELKVMRKSTKNKTSKSIDEIVRPGRKNLLLNALLK